MKTLPVLCTVIALAGSAASLHASDRIPGRPQTSPIAITHATIHPVTSKSFAQFSR